LKRRMDTLGNTVIEETNEKSLGLKLSRY
jgi:hypothetical protein